MAAALVAPFRMSRGAKNDRNDAQAILAHGEDYDPNAWRRYHQRSELIVRREMRTPYATHILARMLNSSHPKRPRREMQSVLPRPRSESSRLNRARGPPKNPDPQHHSVLDGELRRDLLGVMP